MSALSISSISTTAGVSLSERVPQHAALDVVPDVRDVAVAELRVAQPRHGVVFVEPLLRLGRGLDVPLEQRPADRARHLLGQQRLAGAGLALDEQRTLERDRSVHGELEVVGGDVGFGALEAHVRGFAVGGVHGMVADSPALPHRYTPSARSSQSAPMPLTSVAMVLREK